MTTTLTQETPTAIPEVKGELCDGCGGSVRAVHVAYKNEMTLYFCKHHARIKEESLMSKGFQLNPPTVGF